MLVGFSITEAGDVAIQNGMNSRAQYQDLLIADNGSVTTTLAGGMNNLANSIIDVENCSFVRNTSPALGGAVQNLQSEVRFTNCRFNDNSAVMEGGGIYSFEDSIVTIEGCQFLQNEAGQRGGCVYSQKSNVTVVDCLFQQNEADQGGGMYHSGGGSTTLANLRLRDSTFKNNSALGVALAGNGGGLTLGLQPDGRLVEIVIASSSITTPTTTAAAFNANRTASSPTARLTATKQPTAMYFNWGNGVPAQYDRWRSRSAYSRALRVKY